MNHAFHDVLTVSASASGAIAAYHLVGFDDAQISAVDAPVKGVARRAVSAGMPVDVLVLGTCQIVASGPIAVGDTVVSSAAGTVQAAGADPSNPVGVALTSATNGELAFILLK